MSATNEHPGLPEANEDDIDQPTVEAAVINAVSVTIGQWAQGHGFRQGWEMADELEEFANRIDGCLGPNNISMTISPEDAVLLHGAAAEMRNLWLMSKLMLVVTEVAEAAESLRKTGADGLLRGEGNFGEELADTFVRLGDLAHNIHSPLGDEAMRKVAINAKRPFKHGKVI